MTGLPLNAVNRIRLDCPGQAGGIGATKIHFFDDFLTDATIDKTNSLASGFNWYVSGIPSFQGNSLANSPALTSQYSCSNSILTTTANTCPAPEGAWQFTSIGYNHADPTINTQGVPLIPGNKPFYFEGRTICGDGSVTNIFWLWDAVANLRYVTNGGSTGGRLAEFDLNETTSGANKNNQLMHSWPDATAADTGGGQSITVASPNSFHKWGIQVIPRAYNNGTGIAQFYLDDAPSISAITWSGADTYGIEASNYMVLFGGPSYQIDYIVCWVHP